MDSDASGRRWGFEDPLLLGPALVPVLLQESEVSREDEGLRDKVTLLQGGAGVGQEAGQGKGRRQSRGKGRRWGRGRAEGGAGRQ